MKQRIAAVTSNILNPFLLCMVVIFLFSFTSTTSTSEAFKWALLSLLISIVPVFLIVLYLYKSGKLDNFFISVRGQRTRIYLLGCFFATLGVVLLAAMGAPSLLVAAFVSGLAAVVIFAVINVWWKISVHTGFVAGSSIMLVMMYGWTAAAAVALVPLTAWARIELDSHSLAQTVGGALLASLIAVAVFYPIAFS